MVCLTGKTRPLVDCKFFLMAIDGYENEMHSVWITESYLRDVDEGCRCIKMWGVQGVADDDKLVPWNASSG